jgi:cytochrome P450
MSRILDNRETYNLSDIQIAAHASDFVIAGSETTATALSCITYYLLKNEDILRKVQQEIRSAFNSYEEINNTRAASLKYLTAVCMEGMRIYPPLPFPLPRVAPKGGETVDGHFLPEGTIVSTNPFAASMSKENFEDPWSFKPDRWLDQNSSDVSEASQPFSCGARSCMGRK